MNLDTNKITFAHWFPEKEVHHCGYCKKDNAVSYGMWTQILTVQDYQDLIDRGWRRSGMYCYKPVMNETCCPQYTIKCDINKLQLTKSQKKVIKKFNKFLIDGNLETGNSEQLPCDDGHGDREIFIASPKAELNKIVMKAQGDGLESRINLPVVKEKCDQNSETKNVVEGVGIDASKPPCKKSKILRLERKKEKLLKKGLSLEPVKKANEPKSLEEFLEAPSGDTKHNLKFKLIRANGDSQDWRSTKEAEYALYKKYQMTVHNDPPTKCTKQAFKRFLVTSPLQTLLVRMTEGHGSFKACAKLYEKYQMKVHGDPATECGEEQFLRFLVNSPLQYTEFPGEEGPGYGSFHQQYWLGDKLIAVGVIDILPKCVSSVYFFYDPDYRSLTLGTYGSIKEIKLARDLNKIIPSIQYYYMGFYIHSCPKMRYKGKLRPSFLLCPETYQWFPIEECLPKLEANKYSRLNEDRTAVDENACTEVDVDHMLLALENHLIFAKEYPGRRKESEGLGLIANYVGSKCARKIVFLKWN